jgi:hypothetical protein
MMDAGPGSGGASFSLMARLVPSAPSFAGKRSHGGTIRTASRAHGYVFLRLPTFGHIGFPLLSSWASQRKA